MYAIEFESQSKDGVIHIPEEYKDRLDHKQKISLVGMYDMPSQTIVDTANDDLQHLESLFLNSNNQIMVTKELINATDEMCHDIS